MANLRDRWADNADGTFYVDRTCIDCDACRRIAPAVFAEASDHSFVARQPADDAEKRRALMALVACPTGSIGTSPREDAGPGIEGFPETVEGNVSFCGFTSKDSFGAWSYLVERPAGNVLVDSPRAVTHLLRDFEVRGGIATLFLTHRDDVADHAAFRRRFSCERVLHEADRSRETADLERYLSGEDPVPLADDLLAIPTPGHTRGHAVLLYRDRYLFTGDHLAWSTRRNGLIAFRDACWYSWKEQTRSMERLLDYSFEWVLPGHGQWHRAESTGAMRRELERCVAWMKGV
ncbi:MAG: MBL fold metallo-hydrolase [Acidobacteria bacterium]|nr:MBL fold metallo-hydrolase [Acidobacteriota bacterium]MCA1611146.1 MBL fold metallo-hydrolase [Acidobacteriota bacterium]